MSKRTGLLLGGTKMVERHLRRALPTDTEMIEVRSIEAAMKRLDEEEVTVLVFGPTLRRSLALVTTLRSDGKTATLPLVVVYRDDQRTEVSRHLEGKYKADAYVIQSRAQRDLEPAIAAALKGGGAAGDLHVASEHLEALPFGAVSALTQDVSSLAHAVQFPQVDSTLELDAIDLEEIGTDDPSDSATQMMDVLEFEDDLEEVPADDEEEDAVLELSEADFVATTGDNQVLTTQTRTDGDFLPEALPLEELDSELLAAGEDDVPQAQTPTAAATAEPAEADADELLMDDDVEDLESAVEDASAPDDFATDSEAEALEDDASILEDLDDIEELAEIEPFEVSTVTDIASHGDSGDGGDGIAGLAIDIEAELEDAGDLEAEAIDAEDLAAEEVEAEDVSAEDVSAEDVSPEDVSPEDVSAEDVSAEDVSAEDVSPEDVSPEDVSAEDVSAEDVSAEDVSAEDVSAEDVSAEDVSADVVEDLKAAPVAGSGSGAQAVSPASADASQAQAGGAAQSSARPQRQISSSGLLSSNLSELSSLIEKLQTALTDIERLEGENAALRQSLADKATSQASGEQLEAARARAIAAETAAATATARAHSAEEAAQASSAARAASEGELAAAQLSLADAKAALSAAKAAGEAAEARVVELQAAAEARTAALAGARDLLMQAASRLGA